MAHSKNYNETSLSKYSIHRTEKGIRIDIGFQPLGIAIDRAQLALDTQVWSDMQMYMPRKDGHLIRQTNKLNQIAAGTGEVHVYDPLVEYAHYQYMGEKYVDPVYRKGGFFSPDYGFWSRPNVKKVPSEEPLKYTNPQAESMWDITAIENHGDEWLSLVKKEIERNL